MITVNCAPEVDEARTREILEEISKDEMGGFLELPRRIDMAELSRVKEVAAKIRDESEVVVCIGIGGSYLGHRAVIEALLNPGEVRMVYAGNSLSARELERAIEEVGDADFSVIVISKSGTTLEPARAFQMFRRKLVEKYGEEGVAPRIYAVTDAKSGAFFDEAVSKGYARFVVPDNVGGRYSVLSSVGLLPMAVMGVDIDALLSGAAEEAERVALAMRDGGASELACAKYAWMRHALFMRGYDTEVFASFEPATRYFNEWLKQLFGESEGKNGQEVWPASMICSTDLHSLGQFMQEGRRNLWETIINYPTDELNAKVVTAVRIAHAEGGIPVLCVDVPTYDAKGFGELIYFFEVACAVSAKLAGVNPFDQPGVERYKAELKKLIA